jgi:phosphoribosylformylglycinamidine cyclo-ligase
MVAVAAAEGADAVARILADAGEASVRIGELEPGRGVKSAAKGKGEAEAVRYSGRLTCAANAKGRAVFSCALKKPKRKSNRKKT